MYMVSAAPSDKIQMCKGPGSVIPQVGYVSSICDSLIGQYDNVQWSWQSCPPGRLIVFIMCFLTW